MGPEAAAARNPAAGAAAGPKRRRRGASGAAAAPPPKNWAGLGWAEGPEGRGGACGGFGVAGNVRAI